MPGFDRFDQRNYRTVSVRDGYGETRRLLVRGGVFALIGYHPSFIMASGMPTHFDDAEGEPTAIETHVHLPGEHMAAARRHGFIATELVEAVIDEDWLQRKPQWEPYRDWPISFAWAWRLAAQGP